MLSLLRTHGEVEVGLGPDPRCLKRFSHGAAAICNSGFVWVGKRERGFRDSGRRRCRPADGNAKLLSYRELLAEEGNTSKQNLHPKSLRSLVCFGRGAQAAGRQQQLRHVEEMQASGR